MIKLFKQTIKGLTKTRAKLTNVFASLTGKTILDEADLEALEESLLTADIGWELTELILEDLRKSDLKEFSIEERFHRCVNNYLTGLSQTNKLEKIILIVGVNGTGKTTSSAKLAAYYRNLSESVGLVAADTYRAAAVEQIRIWANRLNVNLIANEKSLDPASIAYDGVSSGLSNNLDRIIIDTSGRVHNSPNLMKELEKIYRVVLKLSDKVNILMTIDANTGQNAINQAREYSKYIPLNGIILTKMDGTARGGIALLLMKELNLPVYFIGVGETLEDLVPFDINEYIKGLVMLDEERENG